MDEINWDAVINVGSELLNEIERVSAKRERWKGYSAQSPDLANSLRPAMFLMSVAIERAKQAVQSDDPAEAISALEDLRAFDNED